MKTTPLRVACYARYSSSMQREESISAQLRAMKGFCEDNGWVIVKTYVDEAYSATTDKRPQFQQMIEDAGQKQFDIVLVHKLDRFARNRYDSSLYKQKLRKNGVRLCSVLERLDNTPESILLEGLLESISEFYSANLARETMKGMKENAYKCLHNGGSPGLGYDVDQSHHIVLNEEEAKIVVMIFTLYLCGYSPQNIADLLNAEGYTTKAGNPFGIYSIYSVLRNEKYTGIYIFNRAEAKGYDHKRNNSRSKPLEEIIRINDGIPAIISKEIWLEAQKRMKQRTGKCRNTKTMYLLSSKIQCGECGKPMNGTIRHRKNADHFYTYRCHTCKENCCNFKEIDKESLETYIMNLAFEQCLSDEEKQEFGSIDQNCPRFRYLLQTYIKDVIVYRERVVAHLLVDGKSKTFWHERASFATPTQRCFK